MRMRSAGKHLCIVLLLSAACVFSGYCDAAPGAEDGISTTTARWAGAGHPSWSWGSPDGRFVATEISSADSDTFAKMGNREVQLCSVLLLQPAGSAYSVCLGRYKGFDVIWSDDSKYLVVLKVYLTHNTDIDIYRVESRKGAPLVLSLIFQHDALNLPISKSWVNWDFRRWNPEKGTVTIEQNDENTRNKGTIESLIEVPLSSKPIRTITLLDEPGTEEGK